MNSSPTITKIAGALLHAQKNMGAASKDSKNPFFKSKYADLNEIIDACVPVLNEAGIMVMQSPTTLVLPDGSSKPVIRTCLLHESGEFISSDTDVVCSKQNDPQAYGSAISYARRYGLQAMVTLKAEDDDSERAMGRGEVKPAYKKPEPKQEVKPAVKEEPIIEETKESKEVEKVPESPVEVVKEEPKQTSGFVRRRRM
jgi:hypothetical protein